MAAVNPITRLTASRPVVDLLLWLVLMVPVLFADDLAPTATLSMPAYRLGSAVLLALAVPLSRRTPLLATAAPAAFSIIVTGGPYSAPADAGPAGAGVPAGSTRRRQAGDRPAARACSP